MHLKSVVNTHIVDKVQLFDNEKIEDKNDAKNFVKYIGKNMYFIELLISLRKSNTIFHGISYQSVK